MSFQEHDIEEFFAKLIWSCTLLGIPSLDVWRGVACLLVITFHASLYGVAAAFIAPAQGPPSSLSVAQWVLMLSARGWLGVPLFFVISGYCIAATADSTTTKGLPTQEYFRRRLRRILPPYWAALVGTSLVLTMAALTGVLEVFTHPLRGGSTSMHRGASRRCNGSAP